MHGAAQQPPRALTMRLSTATHSGLANPLRQDDIGYQESVLPTVIYSCNAF